MPCYETVLGISIAFVAGIGVSLFNKYVLNNPVISRNINRYCCCGKCNVSDPSIQSHPTRRNTN